VSVGAVWSVTAVEVGRRHADNALFMYLTDPGKEIEIAYRVWILRGAGQTLLVDTGPPMQEAHRRGITRVRKVDEALADEGLDATSVAHIYLTHLHWDHAANAEAFPHATYHAQRSEIDFFRGRQREHPSIDRFFSHHAYLNRLIDDGRIQPIDGDADVAPGLAVVRVGGHTPGSQMLVVDTNEGRAVIAGDAIPLHRNFVDHIPSGIIVDVFEAIAALDRVRALRPAFLYTGHDIQPFLRL
jgi:glyoxylase-like metal-dependent hydrolase (beta-lactamase superfamily II)